MTNCVLLVRDRFRLTEQCLRSLFAHTERGTFSLVVVNDGSTDFRVTRLLRQIDAPHMSVLDVQNSEHVLAQLKNLGVAWSEQRFGRGDWLYIGDSDTWFSPGWLGKLTATADMSERFGFSLWGGQAHPFHQSINFPFQTCEMAPVASIRIGDTVNTSKMHTVMTEHSVLDGPSWLMRWETWGRMRGFSRTCAPGTGKSEDVEWCAHLVASGGRIGVIQPNVVIHCGLTNTAGQDVPGKTELAARIPAGVIAE